MTPFRYSLLGAILLVALAGTATAQGVSSTFGPSPGGGSVPVGTNSVAGKVKCDGVTITCGAGGAITAVTGGSGDVTGPGSATDDHLATFDGPTGKLIQDSGIAISSVLVSGGALGTPSSGTATFLTGLPVSTGISGLASGAATFLATATSANLRALLTDETGTGLAYFQGGALGTPASGTATFLTGLPVSTGLTGAGTGVLTALGINVGSAGAFLKNNGDALSGTYTGAPTVSGNWTFSGNPKATGLSSGTVVSGKYIGLDASNNWVLGTGGGSGSPAGATGDIQINSSGSFGALTPGTGVSTALGINIGSAGAPVLFNGAGGTPSSLTLSNATGLPIAGTTGYGTGVAAALAADVGGTGGLAPSGSVAAGTSQTVSAGQWQAFTVFYVTTSSQTLTLPAVSTLSANGGIAIKTVGQTVTLTPNAADAINGGSAGVGITIPAGVVSVINKGAANAINAGPTTDPYNASNLVSGTLAAARIGALGTPTSGTATFLTGLPISTGLTGAGTGVLTALGINVGSAGAFVVNGGAGGTPSSLTLSSASGLPVSTGISGFGTGVATALGVNVGSAGALVTNGGALGTPSSGVGTNLTAINASNLSSGTVAAARGGAGTINGVLAGDGAGVVSQGASSGLSDAANLAYLNVNQSFTKGQAVTPVTGGNTGTATVTPDASAANDWTYTLTGNITLANPSNVKAGQTLNFALTQDGSTRTISLGNAYKFVGGTAPTWSSGGNKLDYLTCRTITTSLFSCAALIDVR